MERVDVVCVIGGVWNMVVLPVCLLVCTTHPPPHPPTPTQALTHPPTHPHTPTQTNKDVLINAATGSGKTLCYLAPIIDRMASLEPRITRKDGTLCLIVAPTRELVLQIQAVMALLLRRFAFLVGGVGEWDGGGGVMVCLGVCVLGMCVCM